MATGINNYLRNQHYLLSGLFSTGLPLIRILHVIIMNSEVVFLSRQSSVEVMDKRDSSWITRYEDQGRIEKKLIPPSSSRNLAHNVLAKKKGRVEFRGRLGRCLSKCIFLVL